jgi:DNA repair protein RadC
VYVNEVVVRYRLRRIPGMSPKVTHILSAPRDVATLVTPVLGREIIEVSGVLCLSVRNELLAYHELSRGTLDATIVCPRDVFRTALLANAVGVIVVHNHPSGDPSPSADDRAITSRLHHSGALLGISLEDHVIVTSERRYFSFREAGLI